MSNCLGGIPFILHDNFIMRKKINTINEVHDCNLNEIFFMEYNSSVEENLLANLEAHKYNSKGNISENQKIVRLNKEIFEIIPQETAIPSAPDIQLDFENNYNSKTISNTTNDLDTISFQTSNTNIFIQNSENREIKDFNNFYLNKSKPMTINGSNIKNPTENVIQNLSSYNITNQECQTMHSYNLSLNNIQQNDNNIPISFLNNQVNINDFISYKQSDNNLNKSTSPINNVILIPTPINNNKKIEINKKNTSIDLKDFENETDPFENLSLKVINEQEELDKIFLASGLSKILVANNSCDIKFPQLNNQISTQTSEYNESYVNNSIGSHLIDNWKNLHQFANLNVSSIPNNISQNSNVNQNLFQNKDTTIFKNISTQNMNELYNPYGANVNLYNSKETFNSNTSNIHANIVYNSISKSFPCEFSKNTFTYSYPQNINIFNEQNKTMPCKGFIQSNDYFKATPMPNWSEFVINTSSNIYFERDLKSDNSGNKMRLAKSTSDLTKLGIIEETNNLSFDNKKILNSGRYTPPLKQKQPRRIEEKNVNKADFSITENVEHGYNQLVGYYISKSYNKIDILKALQLYKSDHKKIERFLKMFQTFNYMGFERIKIYEALFSTSLDEEKSLDKLTGFHN